MTATVWTAYATALRCARCGASPGARCRTASGGRASAPHQGRMQPRFVCPVCAAVTTEWTNVAAHYCPDCRDWTDGRAPSLAQDALEGL